MLTPVAEEGAQSRTRKEILPVTVGAVVEIKPTARPWPTVCGGQTLPLHLGLACLSSWYCPHPYSAWAPIPALLLLGCVVREKLFNFTEPCSYLLRNGYDEDTDPKEQLWGLKEVIFMKCLGQCCPMIRTV